MKSPTFKRVLAYAIDFLLVMLISSLFSKIELLNPTMDEYSKMYDEYVKYTEKLDSVDLNSQELVDMNYQLSKSGIYISIINIVVTFLYFSIFQYFNKGQTIGKKLCKVKVTSINNEVPKFYQILLRTLIINSIFISTLLILSLCILSKSAYNTCSQVLQVVDMILVFSSIIMILFRKDGRGLHDLVANTKVVFDGSVSEDEIKEANIVEEKTIKRSKNDNRNSK